MSTTSFGSNVELIRVKEGATPAPQEVCLTPTSDPLIGYVVLGFASVTSNQHFFVAKLMGVPADSAQENSATA
jgi:hypothetical protein